MTQLVLPGFENYLLDEPKEKLLSDFLENWLASRCKRCHGKGKIDLNMCYGMGATPKPNWPCPSCGGTGKKNKKL